jgi:histone H3/H4
MQFFLYECYNIYIQVKTMADLPIAAVVRVAKNSGAERVGSDASEILVAKTEEYLGKLVKEAVKLAAHAGRKTLKEEDIEMAAEKMA